MFEENHFYWAIQSTFPQEVALIEKLNTDSNKFWIAENETGDYIIVNEDLLRFKLD